jgi:ABC-type multidrug transport system fused ATPase/permease subunit
MVLPTEDEEGDDEGGDGTDIVQFSCAIYFVEENEGNVAIDLMRLGTMEGSVSVMFTTVDGSGKANERYTPVTRKIVFNQGEYSKTVLVPIISSPRWSPTVEFKAHLSDPRSCELGRYLHSCRIKVIDSDVFPSDKYAKELQGGGNGEEKDISPFGLYWEYCKLNFAAPEIAWRTVLTLILDQLDNVYRFLIITLRVYMVDTLFAIHDPTSASRLYIPTRLGTACWVAALWVLPHFILHGWDLVKIRLDLHGRSRLYLQTTLFREYMNFSERSREVVPVTDVQSTLLLHCDDVAQGYTSLLDFVQLMGKLSVLNYFTLKHSTGDPTGLYIICIMPVVMLLFSWVRSSKLLDATEKVHAINLKFYELVREAVETYQLFSNYFQRPWVNANFVRSARQCRAVEIPRDETKLNNEYFTHWLGPIFVAVYIVLCTPKIVGGEVEVGVFLATLDVIRQVSEELGVGYKQIMQIYGRCDTLRDLCILFNMKKDLLQWKTVNRHRREETKKAREQILGHRELQQEAAEKQYLSDLIPISLTNIHYCLPSGKRLLILDGRLEAHQGQLVAIVGRHGSGKTTLLRLLAHELFPTSGELFVPSHLRILHVSQQALLLQESVWQNLVLGMPEPLSDLDLWRIEAVMKRLGLQKLLKSIEDDLAKARTANRRRSKDGRRPVSLRVKDDKDPDEENVQAFPFADCFPKNEEDQGPAASNRLLGHWRLELTYTEKVKLHLARALLMNPEVMVLQRPLHHFSGVEGIAILDMLREFVDNKGIEMPDETRSLRRPRSVFYTAEVQDHEDQADMVWELTDHSDDTSAHVIQHDQHYHKPKVLKSKVIPQRKNGNKLKTAPPCLMSSAVSKIDVDPFAFEDPLKDDIAQRRHSAPEILRSFDRRSTEAANPRSSVNLVLFECSLMDHRQKPLFKRMVEERVCRNISSAEWEERVVTIGVDGSQVDPYTPCDAVFPVEVRLKAASSSVNICTLDRPQVSDSNWDRLRQVGNIDTPLKDKVPRLELVFGATSHVFNKYAEWVNSQNSGSSSHTTARKDLASFASFPLLDSEAQTTRNSASIMDPWEKVQ